MRHFLFAICVSVGLLPALSADWVRFRGPNGTGASQDGAPPTEWSSSKNLRWSAAIPGHGTSSPIIVGDRVFVTCYTGYGLDASDPGAPSDLVRHLIAFDRQSGQELWRASVASQETEDPYQGFITQHGYASSTPTSDGTHVFAFFGKSGMFAFGMDGKEVWRRHLGTKSDPARWGGGSSPVLYDGLIFVNAGVVGNQLVALDKSTGETVWSLEDPKFTNCWSTPVIAKTALGDRVLFNVPGKVIAVEPKTGKQSWAAASPLNDATTGSIAVEGDKAFLMGSRAGNGLGIRCGEKPETLWETSLRSGICTPLLVGKNLYWQSGGIFYAADSETGNYVYKERLPRLGGPTGGFPNADYSSPVAVGDNIVMFTRSGESYVIKAGDQFELVAHNAAFDGDKSGFSSTPAIADRELYIRSGDKLYCIAE